MQIRILTLFPEIFQSFFSESLISKAIKKELLDVRTVNYREFGIGKHRKVDSPPYGGGAGMVLRPEPIRAGIDKCKQEFPHQEVHTILISPQGTVFSQEKAQQLANLSKPLCLVCGRFEGFDERVRSYADEEISLGDFVLLGGEVAVMAMLEATCRLVPGVIGNQDSLEDESHRNGLLEYPQYTRPEDFLGQKVPEVLLSGNHQKIDEWRQNQAIEKTKKNRPDLIRRFHKQKA